MTFKEKFTKTIQKMHDTGEFERLALYAKTKEDQKAIKRYAEGLKEISAEKTPFLALVTEATVDILRDAIYFMVTEDRDE